MKWSKTGSARTRTNDVRSWRSVRIALALSLLFATGCTASFTYNRLDWLIPWWVDDYVDLTRDQRRELRTQLEPALRWHREEELGRYAAILDRIEADLESGATPHDVRDWLDDIIAAAERAEARMLEVALGFGDSVTDEQVAQFMRRIWERQAEYESQYLERSDAEYEEDNADYLVESFNRLLGRLNDEQEVQLRSAAATLKRFDKAWLEERAKWLRDLEPLMQRGAGWERAVRDLYADRIEWRTPEYREILDHNIGTLGEAVAHVLNSIDQKQRDHLLDKIEDLRRTIKKLEADKHRSARNVEDHADPWTGRVTSVDSARQVVQAAIGWQVTRIGPAETHPAAPGTARRHAADTDRVTAEQPQHGIARGAGVLRAYGNDRGRAVAQNTDS
jgi:hypothetical protein